jgi:AIPR protein
VAEQIGFEPFLAEWLDDIRAGNPSTVELGRRFAQKLLTQWRDVDAASTDVVYCDGTGDGGIDIAFLDRGDDEAGLDGSRVGHAWYLIQSKYGAAFAGTATLLQEGQKVIDTLDGKRLNLSSLAEGLLERLSNFRQQASEHDRIVLVFATECALSDAEKRALTDLRAMGRERLGALFEVEAVSVETIYARLQEEAERMALLRLRVPLKGSLVKSAEGLLVGSVSLVDLYAFLKAYRDLTEDLDRLYEKNVRRFLGSRRKVNKAIQETLRDSPELFGLFNNGITIVVSGFAEGLDGVTDLTEPYVVNGCQTTRSIWEVCQQRIEAGGTGENPTLEDWKRRARQGMVVTKVVNVGESGEKLLQAITRYTNSQNAVREQDFLALTKDFRTWAQQMAERYDVFLEIQRGGWDSQKAFQKQRPSARQFTRHANAFDLIKVYGAGWLREAGLAFGKDPPFLPNGSVFNRIMNQEGLEEGEHFGVDDLYAAYLLQTAADGYGFGRGAEKASRRQTRFLFYMTVLELLKDVHSRMNPWRYTDLPAARIANPLDTPPGS